MPDGKHYFPGRVWKADYIICHKNRTISITKCPHGFFNPNTRYCVDKLETTDIDSYCKENPRVIIPHPRNCAKYFNCSQLTKGHNSYEEECPYPMLFSSSLSRCSQFISVTCPGKYMPQAPCKKSEYDQNLCKPTDSQCIPCTQRLYSCRGLPNGPNPVKVHLWTKTYITCLWNRTISVDTCSHAYFDPVHRVCNNNVDLKNIENFCRANPTKVIEHPTNCAQFINCTNRNGQYGDYIQECVYPQLFSGEDLMCKNFTSVSCQNKFVPQAPCKYDDIINSKHYSSLSSSLISHQVPQAPCKCDVISNSKHYSSLSSSLISHQVPQAPCKTVKIGTCQKGWFDYHTGKCTQYVPKEYLPEFCDVHPKAVLPNPDNCAKFFNCSDIITGVMSFNHECKYPDLTVDIKECDTGVFDPSTKTCKIHNDTENIKQICTNNPGLIFQDEANCARYYNCFTTDTQCTYGV
ncbi:hypothetical protein KUTeg_006028 [Tegillarca granosa]|uniref:Chitin-binding type-2 domain-containing protein n=1 Tax=Tegillarca granosa TaxID=220873 RepID=A0ABQ9FFC1_TEGGR|nr:hypothetical protein KUTeg_006028 [Tegillarca granosa]